jgi:DNA-binding NarL/FixJ family response regulator
VGGPGHGTINFIFSGVEDSQQLAQLESRFGHELNTAATLFRAMCIDTGGLSLYFDLTTEERDALNFLSSGMSISLVSTKLRKSEFDLGRILASARRKLNATNDISAYCKARAFGLLEYRSNGEQI